MPIRRQRYLPHVDDDDDDNYGDAREQSRQSRQGASVAAVGSKGDSQERKRGRGGGWSAVGTVAGDDGLAVAHIAGRAIPCTIELSAGCQSSICSSSAQVVVQGEGSSEKGKGVGYRELLHPASHCCPSALRRSYTNIYAIYIEIQWSRVKKCNNLAAIFTRFSPIFPQCCHRLLLVLSAYQISSLSHTKKRPRTVQLAKGNSFFSSCCCCCVANFPIFYDFPS